MVRFSARERLKMGFSAGASAAGSNGGGASWRDEVVWAWRGVRGRRWRAVAIVLLFGISLGANAIVFSAADAFVFRSVPYAQPEQLVVMQRSTKGQGAIDYAFRDAIFEWRKHSDLFVGIQAHERGASAYLTSDGVTEAIRAQSVTPGTQKLSWRPVARNPRTI